jgi:hypothetical protein
MYDPDSSLAYDQPEQPSLLVESAHWDNSNHYRLPPNNHHTPQDPADYYYGTNNRLSNPGQ